MGSLGDKFKKLAGDQTRQLLQNFQNAQSSKSKNGYSYGKLNEDGTATLADGTVVQTVVKGRPGQYAPVFNLGNGQGLVDQPEAKFFNVDSLKGVKSYVIRVNQYQKYSISIYQDQVIAGGTVEGGAIYYFNLVDFDSITLFDRVTEQTYTVDPAMYSGLTSIPMPSLSIKAFGSEQFYKFFGSGLNNTSDLIFLLPNPIDRNALVYAYSGAYVKFGAEGKDILIYQKSTSSILNDYFLDETIRTYTNQADTGPLFFNYWILKDFYFEDGLVKATKVIQGQYTPESVPVVLRNTSGGIVTFSANGVLSNTGVEYTPYLSRDDEGEPRLDLLVAGAAFSEVSVTVPAGFVYDYTLSEYSGSQQYFVKGVNSTQEVTWKEVYSNTNLPMASFSGAYTSNGYIYGLGTYDNRTSYFQLNTRTYAPGNLVPNFTIPNFPPRENLLFSPATIIRGEDLTPIYLELGASETVGDYSTSDYPGGSSINFTINVPIAALNKSDSSWTGVYISTEGRIQFVRYYLNDGKLLYSRLAGSKDSTIWNSYYSNPYTLELYAGPTTVYGHPSSSITI